MQKLNEKIIRQGDVLLVQVNTAPKVKPSATAVVLRHGEATGHSHQFMAESRVSFLGRDGAQVKVGAVAKLLHEEHAPATVLPGIYDMPTQVEWTDANEPRVVQD